MIKRLWTVVALASLLSACATTPRDDKAFIERTYSEYPPVVSPVRSITGFTDSLACMDSMLAARGKPPILITSKIFLDASGKSGTAVKELIITALSEMSRQSGAFRFVDFEVDLTRQDTVQYLSSLMLGMNALELSPPEYYVSGAIGYIDQNVTAKRRSLGISADGSLSGSAFSADFAYDNDINTSVISLELHLGEMKTRVLLPGIHASNSAVLAKGGAGIEGGGAIKKVGVQFGLSRDHTQGTGIAVRTLVELGMIELVGKWLKLPYWTCLSLPQNHPEFQRQLYSWYTATPPEQLTRLAAAALRRAGYREQGGRVDTATETQTATAASVAIVPASVTPEPKADDANIASASPTLQAALARFQADNDQPATGLMNFATYERMIARLVQVNPDGTILAMDWLRELEAPPAHAVATAPTQLLLETESERGAPARVVHVFLNTPSSLRRYQVGENFKINAAVARIAYLHCYYQDVGSNVTQIYPNPAQSTQPMLARFPVSVPDAAGSFNLSFDKPGNEKVACFAAQEDFQDKLPLEWRSAALEPIPGVHSIDTVRERIQTVAGPTLGLAELDLVIEPDPTPVRPAPRSRNRAPRK